VPAGRLPVRERSWPGDDTVSAEQTFDYAVIGAGIAGVSLAYRLSREGSASVVVLEREAQPAYHATGRSAAMFIETYGTPAIRALTRASRAFYEHPPEGFAEHPLLTPRGALYIATAEQKALLDSTFADLSNSAPDVRRIGPGAALARVPVLRHDALWGAIIDDDAQDVDVHALHQGYLRGLRKGGGVLRTHAELSRAEWHRDMWAVTLADGASVRARVLINAAGAWADAVATRCEARPIGLVPRRRSAFTFAAPDGIDCSRWPAVVGIDESFYFKPDAGQLLGSPANADPVPAHDVMPEELDIALGIDRIQKATTLVIERPRHAWAGLRSFVPDGDLVVGRDDAYEGFFWLAAQGGYGIQTAAAAAELAEALLRDLPMPDGLARQGLDPRSVAPGRLR
jgi:D-arginine dehydrogenase